MEGSLLPEQLLAEYISINTSESQGTDLTVKFLREIFSEQNISYEVVRTLGSEKCNFLAEIPIKENTSPIILLHHMDVVSGTPDQFKPKIEGGRIWGRGAIDDKGLGVIHLLTFLHFAEKAKQGGILKRPLLFLAVCDEEIAGEDGASCMIEKIFGSGGYQLRDFQEPPLVFDEGGYWISDLFQRPFCNIAVTEKSQLVLKLTFKGIAGHGSVPPRDFKASAKAKAAKAELALFSVNRKLSLNPVTNDMMRSIKSLKLGKAPISTKFFAKLASKKLDKLYSLTHDTIASTAEETKSDINVIPGSVIRYLDIRMLPQTDPEEMISFIKNVLTNKAELNTHDFELEAVRRPIDSAVNKILRSSDLNTLEIIKNVISKNHPNAVTVRSMCPGITDSRLFRAFGCETYGIVPVMLTDDEVSNIHGPNERISIEELYKGIEIMKDILEELIF